MLVKVTGTRWQDGRCWSKWPVTIYNKYHNKVTKYCKECHLTTLCKSILELHLHFLLKKLLWLTTTYDTLKYWLYIILSIWLELFSTTLRHSLLFQSRAKSHLINNLLMLLLKTQNYAIWRFNLVHKTFFHRFSIWYKLWNV